MRQELIKGLTALGLTPPEGAVDKLLLYAQRLLAQNQVMNLTAITDPMEVCELHFLDSAALLAHHNMTGASLIDVGTGAGFPGVVLKILEPSLRLTLLDSLQKRLHWLEGLCDELKLTEVTVLHGRAEELSLTGEHRDRYDIATARAVAALPMLCELCLPYVRANGVFLAMKTGNDPGELPAAGPILSRLGAEAEVIDYHLPLTGIPRRLLKISKKGMTPMEYPRKWAKIKEGKF